MSGRRFLAAHAAFCVLVGVLVAAPVARAQQWNDARTRALVERATARRAQQIADTALTDYRATAHGYLTFLAQLGQGFTEPPKVVRADELALEVYWRAPNLSKQRVVGRRDTLALPTDIQYHRDHLGIVQNNFPNIIRLGEGDEVQDVPHPLSAQGLDDYDFAIRDSLRIRLPDRTVEVYEVRVRPRDDGQPRIVGAVYIDRSTADVVRMAFSFTRPAYLDKQLEDISIVLENALVHGRFWLPLRQEVEIRRRGTWLDFPARGIIRGRWEICCYDVNVGLPPQLFQGPEIAIAPPQVLARYPWTGRILDSLPPDVRAVTDADVRRVQEEAREMVRAQALRKVSGASLAAHRLSDFTRANRVEGLAVGAGVRAGLGAGITGSLAGRYGFDDYQWKGRLALALQRASGVGIEAFALRDYRDAGDLPERSTFINSFASQEFGSDYTDPYDVRGAGVGAELGSWLGMRWRMDASYERQGALRVHANPAHGAFERTIPAWPIDEERLALSFERPTSLSIFGSELRIAGELRGGWFSGHDTTLSASHAHFARAFVSANIERPIGTNRLLLQTTLGGVTGSPDAPPQEYVFLGGPVTGPGYDFHRFAGRFAASQRVEWRTPVPFFSLPLGRFGRTPASMTLAPNVTMDYVTRSASFARQAQGWYPSVGVGALLFFDLLRFDVARGLRDGAWRFSFDLSKDLWRIL